jgi:hypothetical protein
MPGIATNFRILELFSATKGEEPKPIEYLGAIGPSIGDFIGTKLQTSENPSSSAYWDVWNEIFAMMFGYKTNDIQKSKLEPKQSLLRNLRTIQVNLENLDKAISSRNASIVNEMSESKAFIAMRDASAQLRDFSRQNWPKILCDIGAKIKNIKSNFDAAPDKIGTTIQVRDLLHWRKTGRLLDGLNCKIHSPWSDHINHIDLLYYRTIN